MATAELSIKTEINLRDTSLTASKTDEVFISLENTVLTRSTMENGSMTNFTEKVRFY